MLAGGGSFLTLPVLMFLGLPPGVANATNRIGILTQNVAAVWSFDRSGVLDRRALLWAALPGTAGGVLGTWIALETPDEAFRKILVLLMVGISLWTFWSPKGREPGAAGRGGHPAAIAAAFFAVGIYGGFVQAGVGFFLLAATTYAGLDLVRGNAVKVLTALAFTAVSLMIFALSGRVDWPIGLVLAAGYTAGGFAGARLTVLKGHRWLRGFVTVTVIVFAVLLWLQG